MYYYVKDYQGSIRSVVDNYGLAEVESNNYDPTGVEFGASFDPYGRQRYKYTGQERMDEISNNFYDYHARIYMSYLGRFMQMDPMCEQRYNISPYAYCSNNSVNRVDPTGMLDIWDLSALTKEQEETWKNNTQFASKESSLFKTMYDQLDKSETVYKVNIGNTAGNVQGQFSSTTNTLTFRDLQEMSNADVYMEEMFHAYQKDNNNLYEKGKSFNFEFEAKVAKQLMIYQKATYYSQDLNTMDFFLFMENNYEYPGSPNKDQINSLMFITEYMKGAENYMNWNINNNHGNSHYRKKTEQSPKSLLRLYGN